MHWINANDPQADSAEIAKICEKAQAECGYIKTKADDGNFHSIFCGEKCAENYSCNYSNNKCEAMKRTANCDPKPENSDWNDMGYNGTFVQTWDGTEWVPTTHEATFSETPGECAFQCYVGFYWNNDLCEREPMRNAYCYGLPENAEWNSVSEITQTWNGEEYVPPIEGTFNEEASTTECRFKCISGTTWTGSSCTFPECSPTSSTPCKDSSSGLIWSAKASYNMTGDNAGSYCDNLAEDGCSDWHLPTIDELRTLLINADRVKNNCQVSEDNNCLSYSSCWRCSTCTQTGTQESNGTDCSDWGTSYSDGRYSKFGETGYFWSSSIISDLSDDAWFVNFNRGGVHSDNKEWSSMSVRCVR